MYMLLFGYSSPNFFSGDIYRDTEWMILISIRYKAEKPENRIRINLPWEIWLRKNKDNLPYQVDNFEKQVKQGKNNKLLAEDIRNSLETFSK